MWVSARTCFHGAVFVMAKARRPPIINYAFWFVKRSNNCIEKGRNYLLPALGPCGKLFWHSDDAGVAARQRVRQLVIQTEAFVCDPANALPHYPMWDMNRRFSP